MAQDKADREEEKGSDAPRVATATAAAAAPAKDEGPRIEHDAQGRRIWRVGNLTYTKLGLMGLFFWLLWIDFTFTLMEGAFGPIVQFKLKTGLQANDLLYAMFMSTVPQILGFTFVPFISIASDRHRGPRGRRIPFLLYATPVVCLFLAMLGFGDEIAVWAHTNLFGGMDPRTVAIWTFAILFLTFGIFNMFLTTVFYYLFNDVVPKEHIIKFMSLVRAVATLASTLYMVTLFQFSKTTGPLDIDWWFIHVHAQSVWYPKFILVGMAVFYLIGFSLACLKVKEPKHPPPAQLSADERPLPRMKGTLKTLFKECFSHPFYIFFFFVMTIEWMTHQAKPWETPMLAELNLDLGKVGWVSAITGPVTFALTLLTAGIGDKVKAMPLMIVGMLGLVLTMPIGLLYLIPGLTADQYLWIYVAYQTTHIPVGLVIGLATFPLFFEMLPKARYGQFSSAMVMCRTLFAGIIGSAIAGLVMNALQHQFGGNYHLRFSYVWRGTWQVIAFICFLILYKKWKNMGGKEHFKPPVVWDQEYGSEEAKPASK